VLVDDAVWFNWFQGALGFLGVYLIHRASGVVDKLSGAVSALSESVSEFKAQMLERTGFLQKQLDGHDERLHALEKRDC
jgi:hypothetical protein